MKKTQLFVYGTIADPEFFECLLKRKPIYKAGRMPNFSLFVNPESGYLFVKPDQGSTVSGKLVEVNEEELKILDLWEDVPFYERETVLIEFDSALENAFVYTQNDANGISSEVGTTISRKSILDEIRSFRNWIDDLLLNA
ncbi:gamma-glutamylcyclotransferase family protein [uncultured Sunxiuqinia sp.]|uniref:gamma-glutamylcyclotransferase family protein n=1 Tax=uncultured Sunxiuqinia sp. TaxID=1573825 RepID=UPI002AA72BED|nr:gamma-glutamylcyclotransferase family protein [uncultured Sunxiuqinia sp.]